MGRGRAKAKQTKVARDLKYNSQDMDLDRLAKEHSEIKQIGLEPDLMHRCVNGRNQYREQLATSLEQIQAMA